MTEDLVIVGAGGHGRELAGVVSAINHVAAAWNLIGFVDDDPTHLDRLERLGHRVLGEVDWLYSNPCHYALGIGDGARRMALAATLAAAGAAATTIVHPGASIGLDVRLEDGVVIYDRSVVTTNVTIGQHSHLNVGCAVQHDSTIGQFVQLSPGVLINGDCQVDDLVFLGTGAVVTRGCSIGPRARIGAGAVVLDDVAPETTVVGAPARPS